MTFSILAFDQKTGTFGAAAATGSLCVGGWVLRGSLTGGLVASQGTAPSTLWRDDVLSAMSTGASAQNAVETITQRDPGRAHRQIIALDPQGGTAGFTGAQSIAWAGHGARSGLVFAGNMIVGKSVMDALSDAFSASTGAMADRLLLALNAAERTGGDSRGTRSAALAVYSPNVPPLDLRIDHHDQPLATLEHLLRRTRADPYAQWLKEVPVSSDPARAPATVADHETSG
ncbi:MAG: DUF1028 domain-containing protein [Pseudomonadota bacterium]